MELVDAKIRTMSEDQTMYAIVRKVQTGTKGLFKRKPVYSADKYRVYNKDGNKVIKLGEDKVYAGYFELEKLIKTKYPFGTKKEETGPEYRSIGPGLYAVPKLAEARKIIEDYPSATEWIVVRLWVPAKTKYLTGKNGNLVLHRAKIVAEL
jgi:hypothetical protein